MATLQLKDHVFPPSRFEELLLSRFSTQFHAKTDISSVTKESVNNAKKIA